MTSHDKPDPSTGLKEKNWKAMRKPDVYSSYINQFHQLTSRPACCWACASAALSLSVSSVCSAASGAVRCSCPTISTQQKNCKEALLCTLKIWLNICSRISITYIMPQGFPATTLGFSHPGPTACNSATLSLSCWTWRPRGCKNSKYVGSLDGSASDIIQSNLLNHSFYPT